MKGRTLKTYAFALRLLRAEVACGVKGLLDGSHFRFRASLGPREARGALRSRVSKGSFWPTRKPPSWHDTIHFHYLPNV